MVLNGIFWFALLISIPLNGYNPLYGFAAIAGVILIGLFAGTVLLLTRGKHSAARLPAPAGRAPARSSTPTGSRRSSRTSPTGSRSCSATAPLLVHALVWAAANWLLDAASLWVFLFAFGHAVSPIDLLVAYGLANILAVIPITPGGLGVVEGVLIPTLVGFGVPQGHRHPGRAVLAARQLLAADPARRGRLPLAALRPARPSATGAGRRQRVNGDQVAPPVASEQHQLQRRNLGGGPAKSSTGGPAS